MYILVYYVVVITLSSRCTALREKRTEVVAQLKQLQSETEPIVKIFEDSETTRQMQSTRYVGNTKRMVAFTCVRISVLSVQP